MTDDLNVGDYIEDKGYRAPDAGTKYAFERYIYELLLSLSEREKDYYLPFWD